MSKRRGFTLIEVVVSIVLFAVGALALAGSAAITLRQMSDSWRSAAAASVARTRAETAFSESCAALTAGNQRSPGVRSTWSFTPGPQSTELRQQLTYGTRSGDHTDEFLTAVPCG